MYSVQVFLHNLLAGFTVGLVALPLAKATEVAGWILLLMGLTGLSAAGRFIPRLVVIEFTNGIAILIASTEIKDFFGPRTGAGYAWCAGGMRDLPSAADALV